MTRDPKTGWDISYLPPGQRGREQNPSPVLRGAASETGGSVTRDGRWLLYSSDESAGGIREAYVASFPSGGQRRQVSTTGAELVRWNPNGKEILFTSHRKFMAAAVRPVGNTLHVEVPHVLFDVHVDCDSLEVSCFDVAPDGNRFLIIEPTGAPPPVTLIQNWTAALRK